MNITICEFGCGRTSMDRDADIQSVSLIMRVNGGNDDDKSGCKMAAEFCASCRAAVKADIETMFTPAKVAVKVEKTAG